MEDVSYSAGSIVWVKLSGGKWWPGEVVAPDTYPEEVTQGLRKNPLAVVKFFDEDYYEIVKSNNNIHPFVCPRKDEFIKKGRELLKLDPNAEKFDKDVTEAKRVCGITNEDKVSYTNSHESTPISNHFEVVSPKSKHPYGSAMVTTSASQPKPLTSRIESYGDYKTIEFDSGTDVRIRTQPSPISTPKGAAYACDMCSFQTNRIANIIVHHKSHSEQFKHMSYKPSLLRERGAFSDDRLPRGKDTHLSLQKVKRKLLSDDSKKMKKSKVKDNEKPKIKRKPKIDSSDKNTSSNSETNFADSPKKRVLPVINQDGTPVAPKRRKKKEPDADSIFDKIKKQAMKKINRKRGNACILSSPASLKRLSKRKDGSDGSSDEEEFLISRGVYNEDVEEVTPIKNNESMEVEQSPDKVDVDIESMAAKEDELQNDNVNDSVEVLPDDAIVVNDVPVALEPSSPIFVHSNDVPDDDEDDSPLHFAKQVRKDYSRVSRKAKLGKKEMPPALFTKSREPVIENDDKRDEWMLAEKTEERIGNAEESILAQMEKAIANVRKIKKIEDIHLDDDESEKEDDVLMEEQQSDKEEELFAAEEPSIKFIDPYEKSPRKQENEEMDTSKASEMSEELFSDDIIMERAEELIADDIIEKAEELIMRDGIMEKEEDKLDEVLDSTKEDSEEEIEGDIVNDTLEENSDSKLENLVVDDASGDAADEVIVDDTPVDLEEFISDDKSVVNDSREEGVVVDAVVEEVIHEISTEGAEMKLDAAPPMQNVTEDRLPVTDAVEEVIKNNSVDEAIAVAGFIESSEVVAVNEIVDVTHLAAPPVEDTVMDSRGLEPQMEMELAAEEEFLTPQTETEHLLTQSEPEPPVTQPEAEPLVSQSEMDPVVPRIEFETFVSRAAPNLLVPEAEVNNKSDQTFARLPDHHLKPEDKLVTLDAETGLLSVQGGSDIICDEASELPRPPTQPATSQGSPPGNSVAVPDSCSAMSQLDAPAEEAVSEYLEYTKLQTMVQSPQLETVYLESEMEVPMLEGGEIIHIDNEQVIDTSMDVFCNEIVIESEDKDLAEEYEGICLVPEDEKILLDTSETVIQKSDDIGRLPTEAVNGAMMEEDHQAAVIGQAR